MADTQPKSAEKTVSQVTIGGENDTLEKDTKTSGSFYTKVRTMRKHPTVALARQLSVAPLLAGDWSTQAKDTAPPDAKEFIDEQMQKERVNLLRTTLFGCMDFGWQPYEKVFKVGEESGLVEIDKLKPLLQDKTDVLIDKTNGAFMGLKQDTVILALEESLLLNFDVEGTNWYGIPLIQGAELPYDNWVVTNTGNVRYDKKIAGAHWIIHYPAGKSVIEGVAIENYTLANTMLASLEQSGSFVVPRQLENFVDDMNKDAKAWEIELKAAYPTSGVAFIDRLKYLDALIVRGFGLPERAVLEGQFGTKAEAEAHADFAITNMELRHKIIVQQYNKHIVNQLLELNWGPQFKNTVYIDVAPLTSLSLQFLRSIYEKFLTSQQGFAQESLNIDMQQVRDKLEVPTINAADAATQDAAAPAAAVLSFWNNLAKVK